MKISKVENIELEEPVDVYCLEVNNDFHSFCLGNGCVVHNCGTIIASRNANYQGVLPVRGKILNVMRLDLSNKKQRERFLNNAEIDDIIKAIGAGVGDSFDIDKSRYGKIVFACFSGDTKVKSLDGNSYSFKELVDNDVKELWVYSKDKNGKTVPALATNIRKTGNTNTYIEITLDNGEKITCTPDHLMMMNDGSYTRADNLNIDDSLMPLHTRLNKKGYEEFYDDTNDDWVKTYRMVAEDILSDEMEEAQTRLELEDCGNHTKGISIHHKDRNKLNNIPSNLEWVTVTEHIKAHAKMYNGSEEQKRNLKALHESGRCKKSYFGVNGYNGSELQKENLRKAHASGKYKNAYKNIDAYNCSDRHKEVVSNVNKSEVHRLSVKKSKIAKSVKYLLMNDFPVDEYHYNFYKERFSPNFSQLIRTFGNVEEAIKFANTKEFDMSNYTPDCDFILSEEQKKRSLKTKIARVILQVEKQGIPLTEESYEETRAFNTPKWENIGMLFDGGIEEAIEYSKHMNHRVVDIKTVEVENEDVYCMTVDKYHNFLLDAGVFVKNCDRDYDGFCISVLLLGVMYKLFRPLIEQGRVYQCISPLYEFTYRNKGKECFDYAIDDKGRIAIEKDLKSKNIKYTMGRAKGLGELNADVFHDIVLDPKNRKLIRITIDDAKKADDMINLAIGMESSDSRKEWMLNHSEVVEDIGLYS